MSIFAKDLSLMITALNRETLSLERTISANCLSGFVQYEPVNVVFGNRNIYAECSIDYDRQAPVTREFYAMAQNRFHYAITGHTAAEIIYSGADHTK